MTSFPLRAHVDGVPVLPAMSLLQLLLNLKLVEIRHQGEELLLELGIPDILPSAVKLEASCKGRAAPVPSNKVSLTCAVPCSWRPQMAP